ncbi:MAG: hypothetical protein QY321_01595 [Patescibacteria group bacterium]|nr:MAG: hypothetical protein QY321_01595 [Patescibacteria group bacterium]
MEETQELTPAAQRSTKVLIITLLLLIILPIIVSIITGQAEGFWTVLFAVPGLLAFAKISIHFKSYQGWRVTGRKMFLVFPISLALSVIILLGMLAYIAGLTSGITSLHPDTLARIQIFVFSAVLGLLGSLVYWYAGISAFTAKFSEYDFRKIFKQAGLPQDEIEQKINLLKERGLL